MIAVRRRLAESPAAYARPASSVSPVYLISLIRSSSWLRPDLPGADPQRQGRRPVGHVRWRARRGGSGSTVMEKNLDRITVVVGALIFAFNTVILALLIDR